LPEVDAKLKTTGNLAPTVFVKREKKCKTTYVFFQGEWISETWRTLQNSDSKYRKISHDWKNTTSRTGKTVI